MATFSITDGAQGDDDLAANGTIVDQGGPGFPVGPGAQQTPTLSEWALILMALLTMAGGAAGLRRRGGRPAPEITGPSGTPTGGPLEVRPRRAYY